MVGGVYKLFLTKRAKYLHHTDMTRRFHEKVVTVLELDMHSPHPLRAKIALEAAPDGNTVWVMPVELLTVNPDGSCCCSNERLLLRGCRCGGH